MNHIVTFAPDRSTRVSGLAPLILICSYSVFSATLAQAETLEWIRQLGTSENDTGLGVAADGLGNVYISGGTAGNLGGTNAGAGDVFIAKYDAAGSLLWTRQLGTSSDEQNWRVSPDGLGNVYISGPTQGSLAGPLGGSQDAFLAKYDDAGNLLWTRQFGSSGYEHSSGVSADGLGNVYISGNGDGSVFSDPFLTKYDAAGNLLWTRQIAMGGDQSNTFVSANGLGNVYIAGRTLGENSHAWIAKFDANGTQHWTRQLDTPDRDGGYGVATDELGNVYTSGYTFGSLAGPNAGDVDAFIAKHDADGNRLWVRQIGAAGADWGYGVSADDSGNVFVSGYTAEGSFLAGSENSDAFIAKYDAIGRLLWLQQLGTTEYERAYDVSADGLGNVYTSGPTAGDLGGPNAGGTDAFVAKFTDGPSGDYNNDGTVDASDYIVWRNSLGTTFTQAEYDVWRANFGRALVGAEVVAVNAGAANPAVPEPPTLALLVLGLALRRYQTRTETVMPLGYSPE